MKARFENQSIYYSTTIYGGVSPRKTTDIFPIIQGTYMTHKPGIYT